MFLVFFFPGRRIERFFSQDPSNYFWMFACYDGPVDSFGACKFGYFDLQIPARNPLEEDIDLTGLKWDKIAEDLYEFTGLTFDSTKLEVKYAWKGDSKMVISDGNDKLVKRIK